MAEKYQSLFTGLIDKFIAYLPDLFAGIVLVAVGWFLAWFVKRIVMQLAIILRLERFLGRSRWREDFSKADVRYGLYGFLGNLAFFIIFIIFLDDAMVVWRLTVLSDFVKQGIFFFPKATASLMIFGAGWLIATWAATAMLRLLRHEEVPRSSLIARYAKTLLLLFFSAMALAVLDIARDVVIIGFTTVFVTLGIITIVLTATGARDFIRALGTSGDEER